MRTSASSLLARVVFVLAACGLCAVATPVVTAQDAPPGFDETFALAPDRALVLDQLVPGSPAWYFYRCLQLQQVGAFDEAQSLLQAWVEQHDRDGWVEQLEARQALLTFQRDPAATWAFLRERLGLYFDDRRQAAGDVPDLPTRLDQAAISQATLFARALELFPRTLDGLSEAGLGAVDPAALSPELRGNLLKRLVRPDVPGLARLVVDDLQRRDGPSFGALTIHKRLLLEQLQECARLRPELLNDEGFVQTWVRRLHPSADVDWGHDDAAHLAYLERLEQFTTPLPPVHNSLKANVLYWRLAYDHKHGVHASARLLAYLRLPRQSSLRNFDWTRRAGSETLVDVSAQPLTGLPPIGDDEPLVRACLIEIFRTAPDYKQDFAPLLQEEEVRRLFAESKLLFGVGELQQWYDVLGSPAEVEALRSRVEVAFAPGNRLQFGPDDEVALDVDLKHVDALLVRVFELDAFNVYSKTGREIDASVALDGLVANEETLHNYSENPLRRVRRSFTFPELSRPGVYVVELVAGGLASRAVIHKGRLRHVERVGAAGHVFRVLDDDGRLLPDASLWMADLLYKADANGEIAVPFSTDPGKRTIVLRHGERATLATFWHNGETYSLQAGVFVDREALLARRTAKLLVRPVLRVDDRNVSLALLEDPVLTITATDQDGVDSTQVVRDVALTAEGELVHEIQVPDRLASVTVTLSGHVANLSRGKDDELSAAPVTFRLSAIDRTTEIESALLGRSPDGYELDVLGRTGEPLANHTVILGLQHRGFQQSARVALRSDERGRVHLGALADIDTVFVEGFSDEFVMWPLADEARTWPAALNGTAGSVLAVPAPRGATRPERARVSLIELRDGEFAIDRFDHLALADGFLQLRDLPPGDYNLLLKDEADSIAVHLTAGERRDDWIVGRDRMLPADDTELLHITDVTATDSELVIRVANAGPETRVHIVSTRWLPPFDPFTALRLGAPWQADALEVERAESSYHASTTISDEQRYVLDRRQARKFPGNMLQRPTLLLNPWELQETDTNDLLGGQGKGGAGRSMGRGKAGAGRIPQADHVFGGHPGQYADLSFLPAPSITLANLKPGADGVLRVPRADLGPGHHVQVLAVDGDATELITLTLPEPPLVPADRTLLRAFDATRHLSERRSIEFLGTDSSATIDDVTTSRAEVIDSLGSVFRLFSALSGNTDLPRFAFLLRWPELSREERLALLSEHGCHELHLFLHEHDPALFAEVIAPHLRNKLHKTFLDRWLLDEDLARYVAPWEFSRLNVVERILLAQRVPEAAVVSARLTDVLQLQPPDPDAQRRRFEAALRGADLDTAASLGDDMEDMSKSLKEKKFNTPDGTTLIEGKDEWVNASDLVRQGAVAGAAAAPSPAATFADEASMMGEDALEDGMSNALTGRGRSESDADDLRRRASQRALYRGPDRTRELVEDNYWHRPIAEQDGDLIPVNAFWLDFAQATPGTPFVSTHVGEAAGNLHEMLLALALLDLPFTPAETARSVDGARLTLRAGGPLLLVSRQLKDAAASEAASAVFVGQNLFRLDDRTRLVDGEMREHFVTDEFLTGVIYGSLVVITNPSSAPQSLQALLQVPQGALPVGGGQATRSADVRLGPYATTTLETLFYFPRVGDFPHYPVQVSRDGELLAFAEPATRHVVAVPSSVDTGSWEHVSQHGTDEQVWAYLGSANLQTVNWQRIAWRLADSGFFRDALDWLGPREVYVPVVWSYAILHRDVPAAREYLKHRTDFVAGCGPALQSPLLEIDPIERRFYQHIEYEPLINARTHRFGARREIANASLALQFARFMTVLAYEPKLDDTDWLSVTYYLALQDRVEEALAAFAKVNAQALPARLQYDLMQAYLDFFGADHARARAIAETYRDHPVPRWRDRFREILAQLDEAEGRGTGLDDGSLLATEPTLELELVDGRVAVQHGNLTECAVRWFPMDAELLFSRDPFGEQDTDIFATIRPARSDALALDTAVRSTSLDVPAEFAGTNVLVEVRGGGLTRRVARYASTLDVQLLETRGQIKVGASATGAPLPSVYVKVFARLPGGSVRFHKDGYTDLRGRFDYASVSGDGQADPERFALLILSETDGTVIRQAAPPAR